MLVPHAGTGTKEQGYALIKVQPAVQPGPPAGLSAPPFPFVPAKFYPNFSYRTKASDFAPWDLWDIKPAFEKDIPLVKVPANMELRKGDCIKLASMYAVSVRCVAGCIACQPGSC